MMAIFASWFPWRKSEDDDTQTPPEDPEKTPVSERDLRKQAFKEEQEINRLGQKIKSHEEQYKEHLLKGANAPKHRRNVLAIKARMQKFKGQLRQIERKKAVRNLMKYELKRGEMEVQELAREVGQEGEEIVGSIQIDEAEFRANIQDAQAEIQADMEEAQRTMESLQMPDTNFEHGTTEEEVIMEDLAAGEVDTDDLDISSPTVADESEVWNPENDSLEADLGQHSE